LDTENPRARPLQSFETNLRLQLRARARARSSYDVRLTFRTSRVER
jgi:hypothetical protein